MEGWCSLCQSDIESTHESYEGFGKPVHEACAKAVNYEYPSRFLKVKKGLFTETWS